MVPTAWVQWGRVVQRSAQCRGLGCPTGVRSLALPCFLQFPRAQGCDALVPPRQCGGYWQVETGSTAVVVRSSPPPTSRPPGTCGFCVGWSLSSARATAWVGSVLEAVVSLHRTAVICSSFLKDLGHLKC